jgi:integrase
MEITRQTTKGKKIKRLTLASTSEEGLRVGTRKDGRKYSVRDDRGRYFWPNEWKTFFDSLKEDQKPIYDMLINTGARIEEALNIKPKDFDWERNNLTLRVTKRKASKGERVGKPRTFQISSQFARRMRVYIRKEKIGDDELLFKKTTQGVYQLMRNRLKKQLKDWYNFSLHNIRKTHGNYLKALDIDSGEICYRLGHDLNTFIKHYGSANIFDRNDKVGMIKILGDVYGFK